MVLPLLYHNALSMWKFEKSKICKNSNSFLALEQPPDLALPFNQFNSAIPENNSDPENGI